VCFSHLRWDFVYQRPQHLLSRCARERRTFYVEEPVFDGTAPALEIRTREHGLRVVVPHLPEGMSEGAAQLAQRALLDDLLERSEVHQPVLWYYTPMALPFSEHLDALATVYDCMDELSAFRGAPPTLRAREVALFRRADLVFTGGQSLFEKKRAQHPNVHAFPSSVDVAHFGAARAARSAPEDQAGIPQPRFGFFGVLDERLDVALLDRVAAARPDWQFVMVGPVVKIDEGELPRGTNIHYLGAKTYAELPAYLAGWDVALLPFARNESTRFISPTKTPEYLAAGKPVISTSIRDVVRPYGERGLVRIADTPAAFIAAAEAALSDDRVAHQARCDAFLAGMSWENTWERMSALLEGVIAERLSVTPAPLTQPLRGGARRATETQQVAGD